MSAMATPDVEAEGLGQVTSSKDGLLVISPEARAEAKIGTLLAFGGGATGVILFERCGYYFAGVLQGKQPKPSETVTLLDTNLSVPVFRDGSEWGGECDFLLRSPCSTASPSDLSPTSEEGEVSQVFAEPVPAAGRRPIGSSMHTGVVAIDALTPIGRGQSMALFGPNGLPQGAGRTELALRVIEAQHALGSDVKCVLVLSSEEEEGRKEEVLARLRESGTIERVRVLCPKSDTETMIAASAACTLAESEEGDVLVVVDHLAAYLRLWRASCAALQEAGVSVQAEEEGSQQRAFYSRLVERAARRKAGGSLTLLLLQPSVSILSDAAAEKTEFSVDDFSSFSQRVQGRVAMLAEKGIALTEDVLVKVGIPLPGSDHPSTGKGQRSAQHLEVRRRTCAGERQAAYGLRCVEMRGCLLASSVPYSGADLSRGRPHRLAGAAGSGRPRPTARPCKLAHPHRGWLQCAAASVRDGGDAECHTRLEARARRGE